jgi:hypothetical protein
MNGIRIDIVATGDSVNIRTIPPSGYKWGSLGARYVIHVPKKTVLDRIASSNGSIRVEDLEGDGRLKSSNGAIHIARYTGRLEAQTSNGSVEVNDQSGGLLLHTSNGAITVDGVKGSFEAATSNGAIHARLMDPEPRSPVKVESSNGSIDLTMDHLNNNEIRASTSNSSITVHLPSTLKAELHARTSNSHVNTDFDVTVRSGQLSKSNVEGTIGGGGPMIDLSSSNGSIRVLKI